MAGTLKVGTITTPSGSGTITIPSGVTLSGGGVGITMYDCYGLNVTTQITQQAVTTLTDWTRASSLTNFTTYNGLIGDAMSHSSGIFTFPSTGIYVVRYYLASRCVTTNTDRQIHARIQVTTNNSTYTDFCYGSDQITSVTASTDFSSQSIQACLKVTDVSNVKVKAVAYCDGADTDAIGDDRYLDTNISFMKIGEI